MSCKRISAGGGTSSSERTEIDQNTPVGILRQFGYKHIFVHLTERKEDHGPIDDTPSEKDVFSVLMAVQKSYTHLPKERQVINSKDRLYNKVLEFLKEQNVGFTPMQVETTGKLVVKTLTDTLWYLDPHWEKFSARSISFSGFESLRGFFDWKALKIKEPKVMQEELDSRISNMVSMTSCGFFLNERFTKFHSICDTLTNGMKKYSDFLKKQASRSTLNKEKLEPVRSLNDNNVLTDVLECKQTDSDNKYYKLWESLKLHDDFEPLFMLDYMPTDTYEKKKWLNELKLPTPCKVYSHKFGNYIGNFSFVWKSPNVDDRASKDLNAITAIKKDLPAFSTRAMRKNFIDTYSKSGAKPAILRHIYRYLTEDSSAAESKEEAIVDERVSEFLLNSDCTKLMYDLRCNNGRPKDPKLDPFWEALDSHLQNTAVVNDRRHGENLYMPIDISVESLIETVAKSLPAGTKLPSPSWVAFNFWPSNSYIRSAMCYTGRFNVKYSVQQRLTRARHPDAGFAFHQFTMMKEMAINLRDESTFICLDDKSIVPIGEPGKPVSTGVRAHNKSLVPVGASLSALDHDFHVHGAVPSVLFHVQIPENINDSFYQGDIHVTVKDKVFSPSTAARHTTETVKILRHNSEDGLSALKPRLFIYTDGGPDHRTTYWSVQLAYIAMFVSLDLDMLVAARTAPSQSYNNPAERCMSLLNIALQNTALERNAMTEVLEYRVKSLTSMKKIRDTADKHQDIKVAFIESLNPVLAILKQRFGKLKFHGDPVKVYDGAAEEDIEQVAKCLDIFKDTDESLSAVISCKSQQQAPPRLQSFIEYHCRKRTYTYQIRKCDDNDCWYCALFPKREGTSSLVWLPDPTKNPENDQYLPLSECYGKDTLDDSRPSLDGKCQPTEADKRHKSYMNAAQVRTVVTCQECHKRRVVYCRHRLDANQLKQIDLLQDSVSFTCGSSLFPEGHGLYNEIFVREGMACASEIETTYYSAVTKSLTPICFYCGVEDIIGSEEEPIMSLRSQYSIVRPICSRCFESGKQPCVRNALKMKKKK